MQLAVTVRERIWVLLASLVVAAVFAVSVYRAMTQSISHDEALTYLRYVTQPVWSILNPPRWRTNNHLLNTLLCQASVRLLGLSEFSLRLPSLAGGLLYAICALLSSRRLLGPTALGFVTFACLLANPLIMDYLVAARGYSLSLGFLFLALVVLDRHLDAAAKQPTTVRERRYFLAMALSLSLSVAANLSVAFFAVSIALVWGTLRLAVAMVGGAQPGLRSLLVTLAAWFGAPSLVAAAVVLWSTVSTGVENKFYLGLQTLAETWTNLAALSLRHGRLFPALTTRFEFAACSIAVPVVLAAVATGTYGAVREAYRTRKLLLRPHERGLIQVGGVLLVGVSLMIAARHTLGVLYPTDRTGLPLIALITLACGLELRWMRDRGKLGWAAALGGQTVLALLLVRYLFEFNTSYFAVSRFDAGTSRILANLSTHVSNTGPRVRLGMSVALEPSISFYRARLGLDWLEPPDREQMETDPAYLQTGQFDYFVLVGRDQNLVKQLHLITLYRDEVSGQLLAGPSK